MTTRPWTWIVTCEHASRAVPARYRRLFRGQADLLLSHRGWDPGARQLAEAIAARLNVAAHLGCWTRLLVELNRSLHHRQLFSRLTAGLAAEEKAQIIDQYWRPYRNAVTARMEAAIARGDRVVHLSLHSFAPVLNGEVRRADVAFLYDPARRNERRLVEAWRQSLAADTVWRLRRNYPYRGTADGFTTALRRQLSDDDYAGIEVEVNQSLLGAKQPARQLAQQLADAFLATSRTTSSSTLTSMTR